MTRFRTGFASVFFILGASGVVAQQTSPPVATPNGVATAAAVGAAAPPRCDANCVRANAAKASEACAPKIEAQSPTDFDWIARPTPGIFQQADPSSPADAVVRYRGDSVRFMDVQRTWVRVSYECAYDVETGQVVSVNVRAGRLDQPLSALGAINAAAAAAIPARGLMKAMPQQASAAQVSHQPRKPRQRIWEPSPIQIQQQPANPNN